MQSRFGGIDLRVVDIIAEIEQGIASEGYGVKLYDGAFGMGDTLACVIVVADVYISGPFGLLEGLFECALVPSISCAIDAARDLQLWGIAGSLFL